MNTLTHHRSPVLVMVGFPAETTQIVTSVARQATPCQVVSCGLDDLATQVSKHRPFALMILTSVFEFDPDEFRALARDVKARIIRMPSEKTSEEWLKEHFVPALTEAFVSHDD